MPDQPNNMQQQPRSGQDFEACLRRLRELRVRGEAARREIVEQLARMSLDELRRVPGWVIARLGPRGMAMLAERSRVIGMQSGGSPVPKPDGQPKRNTVEPKLSWWGKLKQGRPLWWECVRDTSIAAAIGSVLIVVFPFAERAIPMLMHKEPAVVVCSTLDRWTGDCTYVVGSSDLSLSTAADKLSLSRAALAAANPSLDPNFSLPQATRIYVPRRSGINLR